MKQLTSLLAAIALLTTATFTQASLITSTTDLPPNGVYLGPDIHAVYAGGALDYLLSLPAHAPFVGQVTRHAGGGGFPGSPNDEIETFGSSLTAQMDVVQFPSGISVIGGPQPIFASGPFGSVETIVLNRIGNPTGTFQTEMLQLNLSGTFG